MIILSLITFLIIFSILVLVHEWGHFTAAKKLGIKVEEFGFGMGKRLWEIKRGETTFTINAIPFGGFVKMLGEEEVSKDPRSFSAQKLWKRMTVTLAGVIMNYILAIFLLTILFIKGTTPIILSEPELQKAIEKGIIVLSEPDENGKRKVIEMKDIKKPAPEAFLFAITESARISKAIVKKAGEIPLEFIKNKKMPEGLTGPLGIAELTHKIVPEGIFPILKLLALLSLSLAIMNLLPIPALDGGRFLFQMIEFITFRRPPEKWENAIHAIGFFLLIGLMIAITWNDIVRIFFQ